LQAIIIGAVCGLGILPPGQYRHQFDSGGNMKKALPLLVVIWASISSVCAEMPTPGGAPTLEFRTIPVEGVLMPDHKVTPYRLFDKVVVTVWDPVSCGQKPLDPKFSIQGDKLFLSYDLTPPLPNAKQCTLVSEFDVLNAPHRDFEVHFAGGPEPYVVAKFTKCPHYSPKSDDIWECLAPAK
jgi:hypothetical protein